MSESEWGRAWLRSMDVLEMRGSPVAGGSPMGHVYSATQNFIV